MKILFNKETLKHNTSNHIEGAYRIKDFEKKFQDSGTKNEGEEHLKELYSPEYIQAMKDAFLNSDYIAEVNTNPSTYEIACISVDLAVKASIQGAFAITRPPGHHASQNKSEGFCFFNNIAIAAQRLLNKNKRVCIIDIDGHHGNGTQEIFKKEKNLLFCSIHQENTYPFSGFLEDEDVVNFPLMPGSGDDILLKIAQHLHILINNFQPDIIGISAGFDGYHKDMLLDLKFTQKGYYSFAKTILQTQQKTKAFCCLEGGYHNEIYQCTTEFINGLTNNEYTGEEDYSLSPETVLENFYKKEEFFKKKNCLP